MMTKTLKATALAVMLSLGTHSVFAMEPFPIQDIQVHGLQRVELGTFFTYLPVKVGETLDDVRVPQIIRALYRSGSFESVNVARDGNALVVTVEERATIANIIFDGNKQIKTEQLLEGLKPMGFSKGELLNPSMLKNIKRELEQQYFSHGKYGVRISYKTVRMPRNRVDVRFKVVEGDAATIAQINIVGNNIFSDEELLSQLELSTGGWFSFFTSDDQYAKEKLSGDLEKLRSYYMDRGYIKFQVVSTQVAITPQKDEVFITVNINEGEPYKVKDIKFVGNLVTEEERLRSLVPLKSGDTYSAAALTYSETSIVKLLGLYGYAFAKVVTMPEPDDEKKEVAITVAVEPGLRTYVNRINFDGNETTNDHVLRREIRMMESGTMSSDLVERSKTLLERLPYMEEVKIETPKVEGSEDLVDVEITVKERQAGSFTAGMGYSDFYGLTFQAGVSHDNFLGSGNRVAFNVQQSKPQQSYSLSFTDPYFTVDGVSAGTSLSYSERDYSSLGIAGNDQTTIALRETIGVPLTEVSRVSFGAGLQFNTMDASRSVGSLQLQEFFEDAGADLGTDSEVSFNTYTMSVGYLRNTTNRGIFPDRGTSQSVNLEASVPGSDFLYYKFTYDIENYIPFFDGWSLLSRLNVAYGDGYGDFDSLPYFERFYAGGQGSVRGFERNVIGPKQIFRQPTQIACPPGTDPSDTGLGCYLSEEYDQITVDDNRVVGGDTRVLGGFDLIFPTPFAKNTRSVRSSFFVDVGNLWDHGFDRNKYSYLQASEFDKIPDNADDSHWRAAYGFSLQWLSPMGPLGFHLSRPLQKEDGDRTENFGFTIGKTF